jgi:hypothetical protein
MFYRLLFLSLKYCSDLKERHDTVTYRSIARQRISKKSLLNSGVAVYSEWSLPRNSKGAGLKGPDAKTN